MKWTAYLDDKSISLTQEKLMSFKALYVSGDLAARMADLLWFDLYVLDSEFGVSPHEIMREIKNLESGEPAIGVKPATEFNRPPLKGLWHKHYFAAHFMLKNIRLGLGKNGLEDAINDVLDPNKVKIIEQNHIDEIIRKVLNDPLEKRYSDGKMTGEWIVFAKNKGINYYLCTGTHDWGDQGIYDRVMTNCVRNFPDLPNWFG